MAHVSTRFGWGRGSARMLGIAGSMLFPAVVLLVTGPRVVAWLLLAFATLPVFFAFVHPHRVIATDDDDDPSVRPGDLIDD